MIKDRVCVCLCVFGIVGRLESARCELVLFVCKLCIV